MVRDRFVCRCYHVITYDSRIEILGELRGAGHQQANTL